MLEYSFHERRAHDEVLDHPRRVRCGRQESNPCVIPVRALNGGTIASPLWRAAVRSFDVGTIHMKFKRDSGRKRTPLGIRVPNGI